MKEMKWFTTRPKPFKGMDIKVVSETIDTHVYESKTLAKAFSEITGIKLKHDIIQEGDVDREAADPDAVGARTSTTPTSTTAT